MLFFTFSGKDLSGTLEEGAVNKSENTALLDAESIMDSIQDAVFIINDEMQVVKVNKNAMDLLGMSVEQMVGHSCRDVVNCYACHQNCPFHRVLSTGKPERQFNIEMFLEGEENKQICLNTQPIRNRDGRIVGIVESIRDVGHINNLIQELHSSNLQRLEEKNKVRAILDSIPVGVYTIDQDWRITSINRAAQEITGYSEKEAVGKYCYKVLNSTICLTACPLKETIETGHEKHDVEGIIRNRDGETKKLLFSTSIFRDPKNHISGGVESIRDLGLLQKLLESLPSGKGLGRLVGSDPKIMQIFNLLDMIKDSDSTVLIMGESGTGKNLVAQELHYRSKRGNSPFVKISCASLAETLLESELFGHVKGAFTGATRDKVGKFEVADGGTVFLDEIGEISLLTQVKLLRFLQEQEFERVGATETIKVDVRIIAATNRDLLQMVRNNTFREDLYYRLAVIPIHLPPVRERPGDFPALVVHILEKLARRMGQEIKAISPDVMEIFHRHAWPGNIRELENVLEHGFVCTPGKIITTDSLPASFRDGMYSPNGAGTGEALPLPEKQDEREAILESLQRNDWKILDVARELGINRTTLWRKMKKFGIRK